MLGPLAMAGGSKFISEINQFLSSEIANDDSNVTL